MTRRRVNGWRLPVLLGVVCLALGGVLARQLSAPPREAAGPAAAPAPGSAERHAAQVGGSVDSEAEDDPDATAADEAGPSDAGAATAGSDDAFSLPPLSSFSAIVERPLFTRGRRPAPPASEGANAAASDEGRSPFLLSGVMIAGSRRVALLQSRSSPKTIRVEEGETVEGWKVVTIRPQVVTVSSGGNKEDLRLPDRIGTPPPAATPPRQQPRPPIVDRGHNPNEPGPPPVPPGRPTEQPPDPDVEQE